MKPRRIPLSLLALCLLVPVAAITLGCNKQQTPSEASAEVKPAAATNAMAAPAASPAPANSTSTAPKPDINGNHAMQYVKERSEEHTSELQSRQYLVCRLLLEK